MTTDSTQNNVSEKSPHYALDTKIADAIARLLFDYKCSDVITIDLSGISPVADFFVIASATSSTQARGCGDKIREMMKEDFDVLPAHTERPADSDWIILDYHGVIVHIFMENLRKYYDLENLWKGTVRKYENS